MWSEEAARVLLVARAFDDGDPAAARRLLAGRWYARGALARVDALVGEALVARGDALVEGRVHAANVAPASVRDAALAVLDARTPLLRFGRVAASRAIAGATVDAAAILGVEVGCGDAAPWLEVIDLLALRRRRPLLRVGALRAGGERSAAETLRRARLAEHAQRRGVAFEWVESRGRGLAAAVAALGADDAVAVHVDGVFEGAGASLAGAEIASSRPRVVTSLEPVLAGDGGSLLRRVAGLREHYRRVFEALEGRVDGRTRSILERECYGRALLDRVAVEPPRSGIAGGAGRGLAPLGIDAARVAAALGGHAGFSTQAMGPTVALSWRGEPLVRASAWVDARRPR